MPRLSRKPLLLLMVVWSLACGGTKDPATAAAEGDIAALTELLASSDAKTRSDTLTALAGIVQSNEGAQKLLIEATRSAFDDTWKAALPILLEKAAAGEAWAVEGFKKAALGASQVAVKVEAVGLLKKQGGNTPKLFLKEIGELLGDREDTVVKATIEALKGMGEDGWAVVKQAMEDPIPQIRAKAAAAAAELEVTAEHLDEVVARFFAEEDTETVLPVLQKVLVKSGIKSFVPLVKGIAESSDEQKRKMAIGLVAYRDPDLGGIFRYTEKDEKDPNKVIEKLRCPEVLQATETILMVGDKAAKLDDLSDPVQWLVLCFDKQYKDLPEKKTAEEKLEAVLQDEKAPSMQRRFALSVLCEYASSPGLSKNGKAWLKNAVKKDPDAEVKKMLKKFSRC